LHAGAKVRQGVAERKLPEAVRLMLSDANEQVRITDDIIWIFCLYALLYPSKIKIKL
jgi:hypothetical protein